MIVLDVRVYGLPLAQPRARARGFVAPGGRVAISMYDPAKAKGWKQDVKAQILAVRPPTLLEGPLELSLEFHLPRPKSLPKKVVHHVKKPDLDNLIKAVKDAMKGVIYRDDSQICEYGPTRKIYSAQPGVRIQLRTLDQAAA